ncbi:MAG: rhomboid family intramembrane serine protease [Armatimonadota bacterium]|nr:MAG: rhomboid family intramembrane serine protease [Armatimonadota bacterium]
MPYATDRVRKRVPYATYTLIALNILSYLGLHILSGPENVTAAQMQFGFVPSQGNWYSLITSMFVHLNVWHVFTNLLFLWVFGALIEDALGVTLFLTLLFGSQVGAQLVHAGVATGFGSANVAKPVIGASGAVAGLLGLAAVRFYRTRLRIAYWVVVKAGVIEVAAWVFIALWAGYEMCTGILSVAAERAGVRGADPVAHWAHLGGFAFGIVGALMLRLRAEGQREYFLEELRRDPLSVSGYDVIGELHRLAQEDADVPEVHHALAKQYVLERKYELAGHSYLRAVDRYLNAANRTGAAEAYEELTGCFPECLLNLRNQFGVALALEQEGRYGMAVHVFDQLAEAYPKSEEAQTSLMRAATLCVEQLADIQSALGYLERLAADYPEGRWHDYARRQSENLRRALGK